MQHDIHVNNSTGSDPHGKNTMNTKLGKEMAKYVRLCVDADLL